jgi:hypothetical protein
LTRNGGFYNEQLMFQTDYTMENTMARPKKPEGEKFSTPPRIIGRVQEEDWQIILDGVKASGKLKTQWMTETLLRAAKREIRKQGKPAKLPVPEKEHYDPENSK